MSGFIDRHGYVKYPIPGYTAEGPCEVPGCADRQVQLAQLYRERFGSDLPQFTSEEQAAALRANDEAWCGLYLAAAKPGKQRYEVDHCHIHGWIRGVVCRSCNCKLPVLTTLNLGSEFVSNHFGVDLIKIDYEVYLRNCPECVGQTTLAA